MIATATPLLTVALATLLVNFRHVFYAFSSPLKVVRNPDAGRLAHALVATAVTVAVHLGCGRRTLLSVGAGTATFVMLVNVL